MTEYFWVNGHRQDCAYIRSLDYIGEEEPCDCAGWDDDEWDDYDDGSLAYGGHWND